MHTPRVALFALLLGPFALADTLPVPSEAYPTIQSAVDAAAPGDVVKIAPGTYVENVVVTQGLIELRGGAQAVIDGRYAGPCLEVQADDVLLTGLTLVNGTEGLLGTGTGLLVQKTRVIAAAGAGVHTTGDFVLLSRLVVEACGGPGILLESATSDNQSLVERCRVERNRDDGLRAGTLGLFVLDRNVAERNAGDGLELLVDHGEGPVPGASYAVTNKARHNGGAGLRFDHTANVIVDKNRCEDNGGAGITGTGTGAAAERNRCQGNVGAGIEVDFASGSVRDNTCLDNGLAGIDFTFFGGLGNAILEDNRCRGNGRDGIRVTGGRALLQRNDCQRNAGDGIDVDDDLADYTLQSNVCRRNGHEGLDNSGTGTLSAGNKASQNTGLDLAGAGNGGIGVLAPSVSDPDVFGTGGPAAAQQLDL